MTPTGLLYAGLSIHRGHGVVPSETCSALLRQHDTQHTEVIGVTFQGSDLERTLCGLVPDENLFSHSAGSDVVEEWRCPALRGPATEISVVLGARDLDGVNSVVSWPRGVMERRRRIRTLDTLYAGTHHPGLIVIEDLVAAPRVLAGGLRLIDECRPDIVIGLATGAPSRRLDVWDDCITILAPFGYQWFDGLLLPCGSVERRHETLFVNACDVVCARSRASADVEVEQSGSEVDWAVRDIARNGWRSQVPDEPDGGRSSIVDLDDRVPSYGLYPAESDGPGTWRRWTGPGAHARFRLPRPSVGRWCLRFDVADWGVAMGAGDLRVYAQGVRLDCHDGTESSARYGPMVVSSVTDHDGLLFVDILTPTPRRASAGDVRLVGVNLARCIFERMA